jgi:hypothetical protein
MESGRAAPLFRLHRRVRRSLPNDLKPRSGDQRDRSDNRIRQLMTAGARHRNGDKGMTRIDVAGWFLRREGNDRIAGGRLRRFAKSRSGVFRDWLR